MPVINFWCHLLTFTLHETNLKSDIECLADKLKVYWQCNVRKYILDVELLQERNGINTSPIHWIFGEPLKNIKTKSFDSSHSNIKIKQSFDNSILIALVRKA